MTLIQALMYQDARRQLISGGLLAFFALIFIIGLATLNAASFLISIIYSAIFTISGVGLMRTGYLDLKKARKTGVNFVEDDTFQTMEKLPGRMYIGHKPMKSFQAGLYDMGGSLYGEMTESMQRKHKILMWITAFYSFASIRSAVFTVKDKDGNCLYRIEKKGGFTWRGYVQNKHGRYVAYTKETKNKTTRQRITRYIEGDQCRWSAEGDVYVGHLTIKDQDGKVWATTKRGAVPIEAVDRFEKMAGYLVEWKIRENIPASLIVFLFLMQSKNH